MNLVCLGSSKGRSEDLTGAGAERRGAGRWLRPLPAGPRESVGFCSEVEVGAGGDLSRGGGGAVGCHMEAQETGGPGRGWCDGRGRAGGASLREQERTDS